MVSGRLDRNYRANVMRYFVARIVEPTPEEEAEWKRWVSERPPAIRNVAELFDPWSLYRMKDTGSRVTVESFSEAKDGSVTVTVAIGGDYNIVFFEREVFGVNPDNLEPCEPPPQNKATGAILSQNDVSENIDMLRVMLAPDIWETGPDGQSRRKDN